MKLLKLLFQEHFPYFFLLLFLSNMRYNRLSSVTVTARRSCTVMSHVDRNTGYPLRALQPLSLVLSIIYQAYLRNFTEM